jgi:hypothetical protein
MHIRLGTRPDAGKSEKCRHDKASAHGQTSQSHGDNPFRTPEGGIAPWMGKEMAR